MTFDTTKMVNNPKTAEPPINALLTKPMRNPLCRVPYKYVRLLRLIIYKKEISGVIHSLLAYSGQDWF